MQEIDGPAAIAWQAETNGPMYHDNCRASIDDARRAMSMAGVEPVVHKGWFRDTLSQADRNESIAILRMDADWYESTIDILQALFARVVPGGLILVDDYYAWDGCSKAVHAFLAERQRPERIRSYKEVCFIEKQ